MEEGIDMDMLRQALSSPDVWFLFFAAVTIAIFVYYGYLLLLRLLQRRMSRDAAKEQIRTIASKLLRILVISDGVALILFLGVYGFITALKNGVKGITIFVMVIHAVAFVAVCAYLEPKTEESTGPQECDGKVEK